MIQGNRKNIFQANFFQAFSTYFVHLFYNMYELYESIYMEIMIMPRVKRKPILFWNKCKEAENIFCTLWPHVWGIYPPWLETPLYESQHPPLMFDVEKM